MKIQERSCPRCQAPTKLTKGRHRYCTKCDWPMTIKVTYVPVEIDGMTLFMESEEITDYDHSADESKTT